MHSYGNRQPAVHATCHADAAQMHGVTMRNYLCSAPAHMGWQKAVGYGKRSLRESAVFRYKGPSILVFGLGLCRPRRLKLKPLARCSTGGPGSACRCLSAPPERELWLPPTSVSRFVHPSPLDALFPEGRRQRRDPSGKLASKYRGPQGRTWSGRGHPPNWLTALEATDSNREEFRIKEESD